MTSELERLAADADVQRALARISREPRVDVQHPLLRTPEPDRGKRIRLKRDNPQYVLNRIRALEVRISTFTRELVDLKKLAQRPGHEPR